MSQQSNTIWTRVTGAKAKKEPVLIGRLISKQWLGGSASLTSLQLDGAMRTAFSDLLGAAKDRKMRLPVISLRAALGFALEGVVTLDTDLGLAADRTGSFPPAALLYGQSSEGLPALRETFAKVVKRWITDEVDVWAAHHNLGDQVARLKASVTADAVSGITVETPYLDAKGRPNYPLIIRSLGERLIGEELFEGFGNCELISSTEYKADVIELMTLPKRIAGTDSNEIFSMVARLRALTMPYTNELYLSVSAAKRVWAKKVPATSFGAMTRSTAYVMSVGRPIARVTIVKKQNGWTFGEEYDALRRQSDNALPGTLEDAIAHREFNHETGWWAGVPQLPTLFKTVSPRTVFEGDEAALLDTVAGFLGVALSGTAIAIKDVKLPRFQAKPKQEMLNMVDVGLEDVAVAGAVFISDSGVDDESEDESNAAAPRAVRLEQYRQQNIRALERVHGTTLPVVWMLGGSQVEQDLAIRTIGILFGPGVTVNVEPLPEKTHGVRAELDAPDGKAKARFDYRVRRWEEAANIIKSVSGDRHAVVLICAPKFVGNKLEDTVNTFAGIHAMSKIGANVHHVLPIEYPNEKKSHQSFIHRVQNALLDVLLAHTGVAFGVKEFTERILPAARIPFAVYGVQAVRSRSQYRSGQTGVNFLLFSRTVVETGRTEIKIVHREGYQDRTTGWMQLAAGLSWIGTQRRLQDGDDKWLRTTFAGATRDTLVEIAAVDPNAIVLLDWGSIRGLWRGISDVDLGMSNAPRLDDTVLSAFAGVTFVRLRRGSDTLSLRSTVKTFYEGWKDDANGRSSTGEVIPDAYMTTDMRLVEVADAAAVPGRQFGHFVASMGYAKTVQVKRGFSCYRNTRRISRLAKGGSDFETITLDIASMDASLPAGLDVTVMTAPSDVAPSQYAVLVMGLRLGYAHYNDWTRLPMPLFFERKVDDYIIRYPEDVDDATTGDLPIVAAPTAEAAPEGAPDAVTYADRVDPNDYLALVTQEVEGEQDDAPVAEVDDSTPDVLGPAKDEKDENEGDDALIRRVRAIVMPCIATHKDFHVRALYQRIICGDVHVRVELPYWLPRRGVLLVSTAVTKRNLRRSWSRLQNINLVKSGVSMPSVDEYIEWLCEKLKMPQACSAIVDATTEIGSLTFGEFASLVEDEYNPSVRVEEQVNPFSVLLPGLKLLIKWAEKTNHDALMGWLVFWTSQMPDRGWAKTLQEMLTRVIGPRTQHALEYYLATASAISAVIEQKSKATSMTFLRELPPIDLSLWPTPAVTAPEGATAQALAPIGAAPAISSRTTADPATCHPSPTAGMATTVGAASPDKRATAPSAQERGALAVTASTAVDTVSHARATDALPAFVAASVPQLVPPATRLPHPLHDTLHLTRDAKDVQMIKAELVELVGAIEPGSASFADTLERIEQHLLTIGALHHQVLAEQASAKVQSEALQRFTLRQKLACDDINSMTQTLDFTCTSNEVTLTEIEAAAEELSRICESLDDLSALTRQLDVLEIAASPTSLLEKKKRSAVINQILDSATDRAEKLRTAVVTGICFDVVTGDSGPPPSLQDEPVGLTDGETVPVTDADTGSDLPQDATAVPVSQLQNAAQDAALAEAQRAIAIAASSDDVPAALHAVRPDEVLAEVPADHAMHAARATASSMALSTAVAPTVSVPASAAPARSPERLANAKVFLPPVDDEQPAAAEAASQPALTLSAPSVIPRSLAARAPSVRPDVSPREVTPPPATVVQVPAASLVQGVHAEAVAVEDDSNETADTEGDTVSGTGHFLDRIAILDMLMERRLYGLATIQVTAIGKLVENQPELQPHHTILRAVVHSLSAMDRQSSFDTKVDPVLATALADGRLPSGTIADPLKVALGVLAAGLGNMLFDSLNSQWLITNAISSSVVDKPAVASLVEHLSLIGQHSLLLTRDVFLRSHIGPKDVIKRELLRFAQRAANWKNSDDINAHFHHRGYTKLHDELFSLNCPIGKCLHFISRGDAAKAREIYEEGKRKFEKPAQTVEETFKRIGERTKPDGTYRVRMVENIEATDRFVREYFEMESRQHTQNAELTRDKLDFLHALNKKLADARAEVLASPHRNAIEALYQKAAVRAFDCAIGLFSTSDGAVSISDNKQKLMIGLPMGHDLMPILERPDALTPPLCSADDVFAKMQVLAEDAPIADDDTSENYVDRILMDACREHVVAKRFLPAFLIEQVVSTPVAHKGLTIGQQHAIECDLFITELQDARQKVAHAMTLSAVPQREANRMQRLIEELLMLCKADHPIGKPDCESPSYADFPQARAALRSNVLQPLDTRLSEAKTGLARDLAIEEEGGAVSPSDIARVREMLKTNNAAALRTASDALAMLRSNKRLPERLSQSINLAGQYDAFMEVLGRSAGRNKPLLESMLDALETDAAPSDPEWIAALSAPQRRDAAELIQAWLAYFARPAHHTPELTENLFNAIGITPTPSHYPDVSRSSTRTRYMIDNKSFLFPSGADDTLFIPPELGSRANVIQCFTLNGKASLNDIGHVVQDAGATPTLILARIRMDMQKRATASGDNSRIFLIDDALIAYAALHPGDRLQTIIKIGMLTFSTNPFDDYGTKPVPSEMFFGRQEELTRLRDVKGMAVLYGGRRLGKSSLLNQVEQEMKNVPRQQAVLLSMEPVIEADDYVFAAWDFIHRSLSLRRIIAPMKTTPKTWRPIVDHLEKEFLASKDMDSMLLMIDESDQLMGCEMARKREEVGFMPRLVQLADAVAPKVNLRIVIAGLHNVARMANDENSVFGKADPISLQPYTSADDLQRGLRLITKPLQALGYQFDEHSEDLPLRILSVCNFYPAFVQLYCRRLLDHLQNARQTKVPPYRITSADLDVVEKDSSLLNDLRTKFEWNLKLDKRYKAIALILASFFYSETDGTRGGGLNVAEIRDFCECEFPRHFSDASSGVYEALVDEMTKLNILERIQGRYVLRNPNIAMMIGDRDTIEGQIQSLAQDEPESSRNQGDRRIEMVRNHGKKIFPMPVSWIGNHLPKLTVPETQDSDLLILTGNALSGIMELAQNDPNVWGLRDAAYVIAPSVKANALYSSINRSRHSPNGEKRPTIMAVRSSAWKVQDIGDFVAAASKLAKLQVRLVLLAHPERALEMAEAIEAGTISPPDSGVGASTWRVVPIPPWSLDAIFYLVQENSAVSESRAALEAIREASCGFNEQVLRSCPNNLTLTMALKAPEELRKTLWKDLDAFYRATGIPLSLSGARRHAIGSFLAMIDGVKRDAQSEIDEIMSLYGITKPTMDFLNWMGLMQEGPDHTWLVPSTLLTLLQGGQ
jgi:hypothetical protein